MMNGVSFTGREGMLTKGIKNIADPDKIHEYLGAGKIYKKAAQVAPDIRPQLAELEKSYAISHGTPADVVKVTIGKFLNTNA